MHRYCLLALVAALWLSPPSFADDDDVWKAKTADGWRACIAGKYDDAERLLKDAVGMARNKSDDRKQAMSQAYLALALQRRGKLKEADSNAREAQTLLSANKDSPNPETGRASHALAELRQAQQKHS